jgi:hypothetical protein
LIEVAAVERGACVAGDVEAARDLAALGVEAAQAVVGGKPDVVAVEGEAMDVFHAGKRPVLARDLGGGLR